jgi:hypothetical protein
MVSCRFIKYVKKMLPVVVDAEAFKVTFGNEKRWVEL